MVVINDEGWVENPIETQMNMKWVAKRVCDVVVKQSHQLQQWRGIRVKVRDGNLDRVLATMSRKMQSSGVERLIKNEQIHHIKKSEKRVLARKRLQVKIRSDDYADKLRTILMQKARGL